MSFNPASFNPASFTRALFVSLVLTLFTAIPAHADGLFVPFLGVNFGGDSGQALSDAFDAKRLDWGFSLASMGGGIFGAEVDLGYSPDFFGKTDLGGSRVWTLTGNLLLGIPFGGQAGFGIRPYALAGIGLMSADGDAFPGGLLGENKIGWDTGGGVMIFFATHVGIRGEVRYFRTFEAVDFLGFDILGEEGSHLDFTRASGGLIVRF